MMTHVSSPLAASTEDYSDSPAQVPASASAEQAAVGQEPKRGARRERSCVGCRAQGHQSELVRLVVTPAGVVVDLAQKSFGRGVWVHPQLNCIVKACNGGVQRSLKAAVSVKPETVVDALHAAANRRVGSLLNAARAAKKLAVGADAVQAQVQAGGVTRLVVAQDLGVLREQRWFLETVAKGLVSVWENKEVLGRVLARPDTGILATTDAGLGQALARAIEYAQVPMPGLDKARDGTYSRSDVASVEVR